MLIFSRSEPDDAYKKNAYKKKRVMSQFGSAGTSAGAVATDWEQYWSNKYKCKLVSYQTPYSALVQNDSCQVC